MKRLRKKFVPRNPYDEDEDSTLYEEFHKEHQIRFFHCGEYGENTQRPHYHACLFNFDFPLWSHDHQDGKKLYKEQDGCKLYTCEALDTIWTHGQTKVGAVTFDSAAYIARYITKKINGEAAKTINANTGLKPYEVVDPATMEIITLEKEYITMSRHPGIGTDWYNKFKGDAYPSDFLTIKGKKYKPPKFFDKKYELEEPDKMEEIKNRRKKFAQSQEYNNSPPRLLVREKIKQIKAKELKRKLEENQQ